MTLAGIYLNNAYTRSFQARVVEVEPGRVALDRTAFCPGENGQMPDRGWLRWRRGALSVTSVSARDGLFWHDVSGRAPSAGTTVSGEIDWTYRHRMMRTHTSLHLVTALAWHLGGAHVTHAHVLASGLRLRLRSDCWCDELANEIQRQANAIIAADLPVRTYLLTRDEARETPALHQRKIDLLPHYITTLRVVELEGIALDIDTGTHVRSTREIGGLHLTHPRALGQDLQQIELRLLSKPLRREDTPPRALTEAPHYPIHIQGGLSQITYPQHS